ncbi:predicted protein [Uncinocarpus reesii 1704]|uniref:Uncharacterized protein n=1 Tax=Uncinocarpus reesii (strain UAMH 1704) TaxID=336963 RepID=C4JK92_UNCRE|nr:uncharacterized protein UREG_02049 [Uncinocarpus reesii 1704]EEP77200.1 predicted protein [Uncinocarpus reesii 1704]
MASPHIVDAMKTATATGQSRSPHLEYAMSQVPAGSPCRNVSSPILTDDGGYQVHFAMWAD